MNKLELRKNYKAKRDYYSQKEIDWLSAKIKEHLKASFSFEKKNVHTFLTIEPLKEVNTRDINLFLFQTQCKVATSITMHNPLRLSHSYISKSTNYILDQFKIPTPKQVIPIDVKKLDIVLIPLLVFDKKGNRLGYGKGLYDSFLKECSPKCIKIGVSLFDAHSEIIPSEAHDIRLDYCVTPNFIYNFVI